MIKVRKLSVYNCVHFAHFLKETCVESVLPRKLDIKTGTFCLILYLQVLLGIHLLTVRRLC